MSYDSRADVTVPLRLSFPSLIKEIMSYRPFSGKGFCTWKILPPGIDKMLKLGNTSLLALESAISRCFCDDVLKM